MSPLKVAVLASGRGTNLQAIIDAIESGALDARVVAVLSDHSEPLAFRRAQKHGIPTVFVDPRRCKSREEYDASLVEALSAFRPDVVALAGFMRLLTPVLLDAYPQRVVNIHPSLLPAFPGLNAQAQAIAYGVRYSGCTVHFVDEGMDTGPVILQSVVPV
ncbi:MAG: phosphoribosylglycinamide formyltransferase, partial [Thermacetogeniaceae bacterium]